MSICGSGSGKSSPGPSDGELTKKRTVAFSDALAAERHEGSQDLARYAIIMLVDALAFFAHWIIAKRARLNAA